MARTEPGKAFSVLSTRLGPTPLKDSDPLPETVTDPVSGDPSPQPSSPGPHYLRRFRPVASRDSAPEGRGLGLGPPPRTRKSVRANRSILPAQARGPGTAFLGWRWRDPPQTRSGRRVVHFWGTKRVGPSLGSSLPEGINKLGLLGNDLRNAGFGRSFGESKFLQQLIYSITG